VIYGGGLYAGEINGIKTITKNACKSLEMIEKMPPSERKSDDMGVLETYDKTLILPTKQPLNRL